MYECMYVQYVCMYSMCVFMYTNSNESKIIGSCIFYLFIYVCMYVCMYVMYVCYVCVCMYCMYVMYLSGYFCAHEIVYDRTKTRNALISMSVLLS